MLKLIALFSERMCVYLKVLLHDSVVFCLSHSWGESHYLQLCGLMDNTLLLFAQNLSLIVCTLWCFVGFFCLWLHLIAPRGACKLLKHFLSPPSVLLFLTQLFGKHLPWYPGVLFCWFSSCAFWGKANLQWWFLKLWVCIYGLKIRIMSQLKIEWKLNVSLTSFM